MLSEHELAPRDIIGEEGLRGAPSMCLDRRSDGAHGGVVVEARLFEPEEVPFGALGMKCQLHEGAVTSLDETSRFAYQAIVTESGD